MQVRRARLQNHKGGTWHFNVVDQVGQAELHFIHLPLEARSWICLLRCSTSELEMNIMGDVVEPSLLSISCYACCKETSQAPKSAYLSDGTHRCHSTKKA